MEGTREDGGRYDKQGSPYAIRINREAIHRKDRGRGSARKGEGREGGVKGKERRGKGGEHEEGEEGMRKGGGRGGRKRREKRAGERGGGAVTSCSIFLLTH